MKWIQLGNSLICLNRVRYITKRDNYSLIVNFAPNDSLQVNFKEWRDRDLAFSNALWEMEHEGGN